jgi:hypothetical protein
MTIKPDYNNVITVGSSDIAAYAATLISSLVWDLAQPRTVQPVGSRYTDYDTRPTRKNNFYKYVRINKFLQYNFYFNILK